MKESWHRIRQVTLALGSLFLIANSTAQTAAVTPSITSVAAAGGTVTFTVNLTYPGTLSALGLSMGSVPPGWVFGAVAGANPPQVANRAGDTGSFDFAYTTIPASPVSFTFTVSYAGALAGNQVYSGLVGVLRPSVGALQQIPISNIVFTSPLLVAAPAITSADSASGVTGSVFSYAITATNSPTSFTASPLPAGLSLNTSTGVISGVPAAAGVQSVTMGAANAFGGATRTLVITIVTSPAGVPAPVISTPPSGTSVAPGAGAVVTVVPGGAFPVITTHPVPQTIASGGTASFTVAAAVASPLSYQWRKNGVAISAATNATLILPLVLTADAGNYSVVLTNTAGSVVSEAASLGVGPRAIAGAYFGNFDNNGGTFSLLIRANRSGVFLGHARNPSIAFVSQDVVVDPSGRIRFTTSLASGSVLRSAPGAGALEKEYVFDGTVSADGLVTGTVSGINLGFFASAPAKPGLSSMVAGLYTAGASGRSATSYAIVGPAGNCYIVAVSGDVADVGTGPVDAFGNLDLSTERNARIGGKIDATSSTISLTMTSAAAPPTIFVGANPDTRLVRENLVNISTRGLAGAASAALIAGFVILGDQPKSVLVRAIGPTLANFGVSGALSAAQLEVFRGSTSVATGNDWGDSPEAGTVASTAARVGAFPLAAKSRDAAMVLNLQPGAYTATVTGQNGATGVSLVEIYDTTAGEIPRGQQLINISTRAVAGLGADTLTAGFAIAGSVPKRVLIRGAGPSLAQFGIAGFLARPQLSLLSGNTLLAQNADWNSSADASAIAAASIKAGAFAFLPANPDAALIINLLPGNYTAQLSGMDRGTGISLIEVYEVK